MKRVYAFITGLILLCYFCAHPLVAKAGYLSDTDSFTKLFFYSSGGCCPITVEVSYAEKYTSNGTYNTYNERTKCILISKIYSGSEPQAVLGNVIHSNNTVFQNWQSQAMIYPATWQTGSCYVNYQSATYSMTTNVTGTLSYVLMCDDAIVPVVSYSITLQL